MFTIEQRAFLAQEHRQMGWPEIPLEVPEEIKTRMLEYRARKLLGAVEVKTVSVADQQKMYSRLAEAVADLS